METRARITQLTQAFPSRKTLVTIEIDTPPASVEELVGKDLTIDLKQYRKKRSLDANAYYWQLCSQIAKRRGISKTEQHNRLLAEYGTESMVDGALEWSVKAKDFDWTKAEESHYRPSGYFVTTRDGARLPIFWVIRGSHTYNSEEMSHLINGTVEEAKWHGIETMTPDEISRMTAAWRAR